MWSDIPSRGEQVCVLSLVDTPVSKEPMLNYVVLWA